MEASRRTRASAFLALVIGVTMEAAEASVVAALAVGMVAERGLVVVVSVVV